jgi:thiosulfate reductase/polysulfide reductase chain A
MRVGRRKFVTATLALAGLLAIDRSVGQLLLPSVAVGASTPQQADTVKQLFTACHMCDQECAIIAYVENGVLVKLDGNPIDQKCKGRLCPKGQAGVFELYNPSRLQSPMVRTNTEKGLDVDPKWKRVSWDEAYATISTKLAAILASDGGKAVAGDDVSYVKSFLKALGSPNIFRCGNTCYYSPASTQMAVMGEPFYYSDLIEGVTKYVVMFSNTVESVENPFGRQVAEAKAGGAKIVAFDPRLSTTAAKADEWLPLRPGTDLAAMLAMINVIITENLYDSDFVSKYTYGFSQLADFSKQYTPEWAEPITDIPAATLRRIARELAAQKPSVVTIRRGPSKHRKNYYRVYHAWAILNSLLGSVDVRGTTIADRSVNLIYPSPVKAPPAAYESSIDSREKLLPTPGGVWDYSLMEAGAQDAFAEGILEGPYPVRALFFAGANPMHSSPSTAKWAQALSQCFVTVIDYQMTDTAWFADVLLPCPTYLERDDVIGGSLYSPLPQVYCRQKVVDPLYDTRDEGEIWHAICSRLGREDFLPPIGEAVLDGMLKNYNLTFADLKKRGVLIVDQPFTPKRSFSTPSGKIELYSNRFKDAGFDPLPSWKGQHIEPTSDYPLYFTSFNDATKYMSMESWNPVLEGLMDPYLWLNPDTASKYGIADGDAVLVESPYGSLTISAKLTQGIRPDTVAMAHGRGFKNPYTNASAREGANDSLLARPSKGSDHVSWYSAKEEPFGVARFTDFTVRISKGA